MARPALAVLALFVCSHALGQEPLPPGLHGEDKLAALIQRVSQVQAGLATLSADFEQVRTSHLLAEPSHSHGRFYYRAPDNVRWDYDAPRAMTVLITGGVAITYRPAEKRAERVEVGRAQRRILRFISASEPLEKLKLYFSFTFIDRGERGNYTLKLDPTSYMMKKRLHSLSIDIDRTTFLPVKVSYTEADGDTTEYWFTHVRPNAPQPAALYELSLPPDVSVVEIKLGHSE